MTPSLPSPNPLRIRRAVALVIGWFAATVAGSVLIYFLARATGFVTDGSMNGAMDFLKNPGVEVAAAIGATLFVVQQGWRDSGLGWRALVPCQAPARAHAAGLILIFGCSTLLSEFTNLLTGLVPMPEWMLRSTLEAGSMGPIQMIILAVIVAPIAEELMMRGIILRRLRVRLGTGRALMVSSLLFGLAHGFPVQVLDTFIIGLVLGWIFLRTNSLLIPILGHAFNNAIVTGFLISGVQIPGAPTPPQSGVLQLQPWWLDVIGIACVVVAWRMFRALPPVASRSIEPPLLPTTVAAADSTTTASPA